MDIYNQFLTPACILPKARKGIENTDIMLRMVKSGRGVAALPRWLVNEYTSKMAVTPIRLSRDGGIFKQIFLGMREVDMPIDYLGSFVNMARKNQPDIPVKI